MGRRHLRAKRCWPSRGVESPARRADQRRRRRRLVLRVATEPHCRTMDARHGRPQTHGHLWAAADKVASVHGRVQLFTPRRLLRGRTPPPTSSLRTTRHLALISAPRLLGRSGLATRRRAVSADHPSPLRGARHRLRCEARNSPEERRPAPQAQPQRESRSDSDGSSLRKESLERRLQTRRSREPSLKAGWC